MAPIRGTAKNSYLPHTLKHEKPARWRCSRCSPVSNRHNHHLAVRGNERKHARAPFSAVRASWKLKVDGFLSSRGALHDAHHQKAPNAKKTGGRWAAARRPPGRLRPGGCFPHGMQTRETHYLSFSASGGLLLTPRSHKPAGKPTENPDPQNRKQYLGIHGTFSIARPSGKPESSMNSEVLLPILKVRIFAGFPGWLVTARHK